MIPRVADISHHNTVSDFADTAKAGIWGIIHKASEGISYVDPTYAGRRKPALNAGLLWGAYAFNTGANVTQQVDHFLNTAKPDDTTLMVLDYEDNQGNNMTIHQAVDFMHQLEAKLGREAALYSGNRLKETIDALGPVDRGYLTSRRLWLAQYGPTPRLPAGFKEWWLWQYTDGQVGPQPHGIAGISGLVDLNVYIKSTQAQLKQEWAGQPLTKEIPPMADTTTPAPVPAPATPAHDPVPAIINALEAAKTWVPRFVPNLPWWAQIALSVGVPILEQGLNLYEDSKNKSTPDIMHSVGGLISSIGQGVQTAVVASKVPPAPVSTAPSEGMPNA